MNESYTLTDPIKRDRMKMLIDAMRSGNYAQGRLSKRLGDSFCAIGLACELSNLGSWAGKKGEHYQDYVIGEKQSYQFLPQVIIDYYGFKTIESFPIVLANKIPKLITDLNDSDRLSFGEIADLLEKTYLQNIEGS